MPFARWRTAAIMAIDALSAGQLAWDAEVRGFGLRCQRRDRVYLVKYRAQGRQR